MIFRNLTLERKFDTKVSKINGGPTGTNICGTNRTGEKILWDCTDIVIPRDKLDWDKKSRDCLVRCRRDLYVKMNFGCQKFDILLRS